MEFQGLPEAVNAGLYLVPRMTRDELRSAITGPVAVACGQITQRLVLRLLNDIGDDPDQLPVLQHALMRTWDHWEGHRQPGQSIDVADYEAIGTLQHALSVHAEEAYHEAGFHRNQQIVEKIFKALTDTFSDPRGVRRPTSVQELAAICQASEPEAIQVIEIFRRPGRSFLTPPADTPLDSRSIIDLSHESLMRCWTRLITWAEEERESATTYTRVAQAAAWCEECVGGLWVDPQLEIGLQWKRKNQPTAAWAERYDSNFAEATEFLDRSEKQRQAEREKERRRKLTRQIVSYVLTTLLVIVLALLYQVRKQKTRAENNLMLAKNAVDQSLSSAGNEQAREAADSPQMEEFRKELLHKAKAFYLTFAKEEPRSEELRNESALASSRLADINRLLEMHDDAVEEYKEAISRFGSLAQQHLRKPEYRQRLAYCHNWLGETLRLWLEQAGGNLKYTSADAENEYNAALRLQQELHSEVPKNADYQQELARTYYNRGILRDYNKLLDKAEADFNEAIRLLEPLTEEPGPSRADEGQNPPPAQELARVYNNLGLLLDRKSRLSEAQSYFDRAISIHEQLVKDKPDKREYKEELARWSENLAMLLVKEKKVELAEQANHRAVHILDGLVTPGMSLNLERAKAHMLRGQILESHALREAQSESQKSFDIMQEIKIKLQNSPEHPEFHIMYMNLAVNYIVIAEKGLASGALEDAREALESLLRLLPELSGEERRQITKAHNELQEQLHDKMAKHR